jgi:hypothetical protein
MRAGPRREGAVQHAIYIIVLRPGTHAILVEEAAPSRCPPAGLAPPESHSLAEPERRVAWGRFPGEPT